MGEIIERIPHKSVAYAFLEIRAGSGNEFESLRRDALKRAPHYGFAADAPKAPVKKDVAAAEVAAEPAEVTGDDVEAGAQVEAQAEQASAAAAPTEGLSPREKAKAKLAAKKGA